MSERLFSQEELNAMCRSPKEKMTALLVTGDKEAAKQQYAELEDAFFAFHDIYHHWVALGQEFIYQEYGHDGLAKAVPISAILVEALKLDMSVGEVLNCSKSAKERMNTRIDTGDTAEVLEYYDYMEKGFRDIHDLYREWTSLLLSHVYREYGIDVLEKCLRHSSDQRWMPWMMDDVTQSIQQRLRGWVILLLGNFAILRIEEDDEKFILFQDPCGSCGRQIRQGCYKQPFDLAIVKEKHPISFMQGDVTVYQAHIAVMHTIMPIERIGAPWPAINCPKGATGGPCEIYMYKDPKNAAPEHYAMVGMQQPNS